MKTGCAVTALPNSGPSSPPSLPCTWRGAGVCCAGGQELGVRNLPPVQGKGIRKRLRGRQGLQFEDPQPDLQFPEVFRKEEGMGSSKSSGFLWLHILVKPAAENCSLFFWPHPVPLQRLDQGQGTSLLPSRSPPYLSLGPVGTGVWTLLSGHGWEVAGNLGSP